VGALGGWETTKQRRTEKQLGSQCSAVHA